LEGKLYPENKMGWEVGRAADLEFLVHSVENHSAWKAQFDRLGSYYGSL